MELLNLDTLVKTNRGVVLCGVEYAVAQQTVGMLLDAIAATKLTDKDGDKMFEQMVRSAKRILPDAPAEIIESMNLDQITALIEFGVATTKEVIENSESEEGDKEGK